jgi:formylmethanofuran dehydrogenase subunit E
LCCGTTRTTQGWEKIMATDYDAPRRSETDELTEDSLEELKARRNEAQSGAVDVDESESAENFELPGADLSGEELTVRVLPKQADEFTCSSCFLVHHRSRLAVHRNGRMVCRDCAA